MAARSHGDSRRCDRASAPEYEAWHSIQARCHNPNRADYQRYGARGVTVCSEWRGSGGYDRFLAHVGRRPSDAHSIDRIDNGRGYEPGNVRWVTRREQALNQKKTLVVEFRGERAPVSIFAERLGISRMVVAQRLKNGWSIARALTTPVMGRSEAARFGYATREQRRADVPASREAKPVSGAA